MHVPVLLKEVLQTLNPENGKVYIDATFGGGGYTKAILQSANCKVIALDRDESVFETAKQIKQEFGERFEFFHTPFSKIDEVLKGDKVDGIVADFGVSSMQFDLPERGFSFLKEGRLDMRMGKNGMHSAYTVVNQMPEPELIDIIFKYGQEKLAKKIAGYIVRARSKAPIQTTTELASLIYDAYGSEVRYSKIHPATKTFQAIRIFVNEELNEIEALLAKSIHLLNKGGRLICVSFHSLEDAIVKDFITKHSRHKQKINKYAEFSKSQPLVKEEYDFDIITKDIIVPSPEEVAQNIRSRSARLRGAIKI